MGWHCDDEPLFGKCGDAKLIVSVSFGSSALFRWRRQSCPDDEAHLCCIGHGDILVTDDQCQDEFLHRTDSGREQASAGQPSLHGHCACMVYWNKGALRRNRRLKNGKTSFSPCRVFSV